MTRTGFDKSLQKLHNDLLCMGSMVEKQLYLSMDALMKHDSDLADKIIEGDDAVDTLQKYRRQLHKAYCKRTAACN